MEVMSHFLIGMNDSLLFNMTHLKIFHRGGRYEEKDEFDREKLFLQFQWNTWSRKIRDRRTIPWTYNLMP